MTDTLNRCCEEFEKHCRSVGVTSLHKVATGARYGNDSVEVWWIVWQAAWNARSHAPSEIPVISDSLRKEYDNGQFDAYRSIWLSWQTMKRMENREAHRWILGLMERYINDVEGKRQDLYDDQINAFFAMPSAPKREAQPAEISVGFYEWCASVKDCGHEVQPNSATARQRKLGWDAAMATKLDAKMVLKKIAFTCERTGRRWQFNSMTQFITAFLDATQPTRESGEDAYIIRFEDTKVEDELFWGHGAEQAAHKRFKQISDSWNATLFRKVKSNWYETERHSNSIEGLKP